MDNQGYRRLLVSGKNYYFEISLNVPHKPIVGQVHGDPAEPGDGGAVLVPAAGPRVRAGRPAGGGQRGGHGGARHHHQPGIRANTRAAEATVFWCEKW